MRRVLSTYLFVNRKLTAALIGGIAHAAIPAIELFCSKEHFDYRSPQESRELAGWLSGHDLALHSLHAPTDRDIAPGRESGVPLSIADPERVRRLEAVDEIKRAIDLVEVIPFRFLVQHVGGSREPDDPKRWDAAFNSLEHLLVFAKQRGVTIALENTPGELATPANLCKFIEETRLTDLRLCFDAGHAHMEEGVEKSFAVMREKVVTTHIHDNRGEKDEHLLPYEGTIDWKAALKAIGNELPLVLELKEKPAPAGAETPAADAIQAARSAFGKLEQALAAKT